MARPSARLSGTICESPSGTLNEDFYLKAGPRNKGIYHDLLRQQSSGGGGVGPSHRGNLEPGEQTGCPSQRRPLRWEQRGSAAGRGAVRLACPLSPPPARLDPHCYHLPTGPLLPGRVDTETAPSSCLRSTVQAIRELNKTAPELKGAHSLMVDPEMIVAV